MEKFIPYEKLSKKEKRKLDRAKRQTWGELNPVTRKPENSKAYNRKRTQDWKHELPVLRPLFWWYQNKRGWLTKVSQPRFCALGFPPEMYWTTTSPVVYTENSYLFRRKEGGFVMKKVLSLLVVFCLLLSTMPLSVWAGSVENPPAADSDPTPAPSNPVYSSVPDIQPRSTQWPITGQCGDNVTWSLTEDGVLTLSGTGKTWDYLEKSPGWFDYMESIQKCVIEEGVTSIGETAFYNCKNLTSVEIPNSVTYIADHAFNSCESLTSVEIPGSVTHMGVAAFAFCTKLSKVIIPASITRISNSAFAFCESLTSVEIPDSVTYIGEGAFEYCTSLHTVTIPNSVRRIDLGAFDECKKLRTVHYGGTEAQWALITIDSRNSYLTHATLLFEPKAPANGGHTFVDDDDTECDICGQKFVLIRFDTTGGTVISQIRATPGETIYLDTCLPTRSGYTFTGWSTVKNGTVEFTSNSLLETDVSILLYACWDKLCVTCRGTGEKSTTCGDCDGTGKQYFPCTKCNGEGEHSHKSTCPYCLGSCVVCAKCGSLSGCTNPTQHRPSKMCYQCEYGYITTHTKCDTCSGKGYRQPPQTCSSCTNGKIVATCTECNGIGIVIRDHVSAPGAPIPESIGATTVVLQAIDNGLYSSDGIHWQDSPVFENLETDKEYCFYQRYGSTDYDHASQPSPALVILVHAHKYDYPCSPCCSICGASQREVSHTFSSDTDTSCDLCGSTMFPVIFNGNGGTGFDTVRVNPGSKITLPSDKPVRYLYHFDGWATTKSGEPVCQPGDLYEVNALTTLYAQWTLTCTKCDSNGISTLQCYKCRGSGTLSYEETCSRCDGDGSVTIGSECFTCSYGTGFHFTPSSSCINQGHSIWYVAIPCETCQEQGKIVISETCKACSGTGKSNERCTYCSGDKLVDRKQASAPDAPIPERVEDTTVVLQTIDNGEYSADGVNWQDSPIFENLVTGKEYTFYQRYAKTDYLYASSPSEGLVIVPGKPFQPIAKPCGDNVTWSLTEDGVLTISGTGPTWDYSSLEHPGWYYYRDRITKCVIQEGVTAIGDYLFYESSALTGVELPNSLNDIGDGAFRSCRNLTAVTIPDGITRINTSTFYYCSSLTAVTIPDSVTSIEGYAFSICSNLTDVYYGGSRVQWSNVRIDRSGSSNQALGNATIHYAKPSTGKCGSNVTWSLTEDGVLTLSGTGETWYYSSWERPGWYDYLDRISKCVIQEGITSIGDNLFYNSVCLTSIDIPDSVTYIGDSAFYRCPSLTDVYYGGSEAQWAQISIGSWNDALTNATIHFDYADHTPGDINGDGKVNSRDATRLFQFLAGWEVEVDENALDVNGDGKVNNRDATLLFQYLAGWNVELH